MLLVHVRRSYSIWLVWWMIVDVVWFSYCGWVYCVSMITVWLCVRLVYCLLEWFVVGCVFFTWGFVCCLVGLCLVVMAGLVVVACCFGFVWYFLALWILRFFMWFAYGFILGGF